MKIKSLLIGMLACTALVGCSDDDVLNNAEQENQQVEKMQAYMSFSIASSINSSRGMTGEGTTTGDNHGNQEHSGHENDGTTAENKVNSILIVFYNENESSEDGFSYKFTMTTTTAEDGTPTTASDDSPKYNSYSTRLVPEGTDGYRLESPFALNSLGSYKVLVVLNPSSKITSTSASNRATAKEIYDAIIAGSASSVEDIIGSSKNNFMMANRKEITINVSEKNNDPSTAAGKDDAPIEVERVVSKITFRHKAAATDFPKNGIGEIKDGKDLYEITEQKYKTFFTPVNFWYLNPTTGIYDYLTSLYKAYDNHNVVYYVYVDAAGNTTFYKDSGKTHTGDLEGQKDVPANIVTLADRPTEFYYDGSKVEDGTANYYIQLKKFALVNLSKNVYYVRHTSDLLGENPTVKTFGYASTTNYIVEPKTLSKSGMTFTTQPSLAWPTDVTATDYFSNDFITVTNAITNGTGDSYFTSFNSDDQGKVDNDITPTGGIPSSAPSDKEAENVGTLMGYCLENSVVASNQNALTSTGVIFEAQIYDENGEIVSPMFKYDNTLYPSLEALIFATAADDDKEMSPFRDLTDEKFNNGTITKEQLAQRQITVYENGKCYYFSAEIKHFDDNAESKGVMEYAIMRNNIYSLAVNSVDGFGFSSMDIQSGVLNNSTTEQEKVYLTMKAKILPWIVRFNNITF